MDLGGNPVLSSGGQPLRIDPNKTMPTIAHDGTISQDGVVAGKVGTFQVADRAQLGKESSGMFDPGAQTPTADPKTTVQQGMLENSIRRRHPADDADDRGQPRLRTGVQHDGPDQQHLRRVDPATRPRELRLRSTEP
ncbi:MAG: hypothetical protein WDN45_04885 [Caulobacteraceae bacterium]